MIIRKFTTAFPLVAKANLKISENKKIQAREKSINRILSSAIVLFSKHGFAQTTMEMIANHAKISKGLAYNYFKSKVQIFEEIIDQHLAKQELFYRNIPNNLSARDYVKEFFERSMQFAEQERKTMVLISVCLVQPGSISLSKKMMANIDKKLAPFKEAMLERFTALGIKEPEKEMMLIRTFLHGIFMGKVFHDENICPTTNVVDLFLERYERNFRK